MKSKYKVKQISTKTKYITLAPVAGKAVKGEMNRKTANKLAMRIYAWKNPETKRFTKQISEGGAKCPGSTSYL